MTFLPTGIAEKLETAQSRDNYNFDGKLPVGHNIVTKVVHITS